MKRAIAALAFLLTACGDPSHLYTGRLYLEERDCVATTSSLDVVEGEEPGSCPAACLVQTTLDGGRAVYVSTMCAPYPYAFDTSGTHSSCAVALSAFARNDTCLVDGGSTNAAPRDAAAAD